ncbi:MAG: cation:dicarboxylase symporter family transporter, partial [Pedobacter sp.]
MKQLFSHLTFQVIIAILLGVITGSIFPGFSETAKLISQTFINMITMLIAPIIFLTIVLGIAAMDDMKKIGRVGGKALLYFEVVTTFAIVIGMIIANVMKPGEGVDATLAGGATIAAYSSAPAEINMIDFIAHIVPHNIVDAFAKGDILQVLFFAVLFGLGLSQMKESGASLISSMDKISKVLFNIMKFIMKLAPVGAFGGMAYTIGTYGVQSLIPMAQLMFAVYLTMALFIFVVLNIICKLYKCSLWEYLKFIRQEILIVLGTSSSESV